MDSNSYFDRLEARCLRLLGYLARRPVLAGVLLAMMAVCVSLPGQTVLPAIDRTEGVVALSSRYIVENGDWLRPRWEDNLQRTRPAGTFWTQGLALATATAPEAKHEISTYRLPSLVATVLAVLLMYGLSRHLLGAMPALIASAAIAVTPVIALHANLAIAEPLVLPSIIVAQLALLAIHLDGKRARWWGWLGAFWIALGISTWFNALAVPILSAVTVIAVCAADRSFVLAKRLQPWFGLGVLVVLALPWLGAVWTIDNGALYRGMTFGGVLDALEGGQSMNFKTVHGVFILTLLLGFLPVAHMLGPVIRRYWSARHVPLIRFLLIWLIVPVVALELFSNKPPLYTVHAVMPAGALLVALAVLPGSATAVDARAWPGMFVGTAVVLLAVAPALFGSVLWVTETPPSLLLIAGFMAFTTLFLVAGWAAAQGHGTAWMTTAVAGTFLFTVWFNGLLMPGLGNFWTAPQIATVAQSIRRCGGNVTVAGFREPSLELALGPDVTPETAARKFTDVEGAYAVVESRLVDRFEAAVAAAGGASGQQRLDLPDKGCLRSLNLARGCSLLFKVYEPRTGAAAAGSCALGLPKDCAAKHELLRRRLKIPHCG